MAIQQTRKLWIIWQFGFGNILYWLLLLTTFLLSWFILLLCALMWLNLEVEILSLTWIERISRLHVDSIFGIFIFELLLSLHHFHLCLILQILRWKMLRLYEAIAGFTCFVLIFYFLLVLLAYVSWMSSSTNASGFIFHFFPTSTNIW